MYGSFVLRPGLWCRSLYPFLLYNYFAGKKRVGYFTKMVSPFHASDFKCSVILPHSALGWSAVCACGIS